MKRISMLNRVARAAATGLFLTLLAMGLGRAPAFGQTSATWADGQGNWSDAVDWYCNPPGAPCTTYPTGNFDVSIIDGTSMVTMDVNPSVKSLCIDSGNTLTFAGTQTLTFNANGTLNPPGCGNGIINAGAGTISAANWASFNLGTLNYGTLSVPSGTLTIISGTDNNTVFSASGSGVIQTAGGLDFNGSFNGITNSVDSTLTLQGGNNTGIPISCTITNNGTINNDTPLGGGVAIQMCGLNTITTLAGTGAWVFASSSSMYPGQGGNRLQNETTIEGQGSINCAGVACQSPIEVDNKGTIDANVSGASFTIEAQTLTNSGTLQATKGGILVLNGASGPAITNTNTGTIEALDSSNVQLKGVVITGGTLTTTGTGLIDLQCCNNGATLNNLTVAGTYTNDNGGSTILEGTIRITNTGMLTNSAVEFSVDGNVTLTGRGSMNGFVALDGLTGSDILTNESTIEGPGNIGCLGGEGCAGSPFGNVGLVNEGTINANDSTTGMLIDAGSGALSFNNKGTLIVGSAGMTIEGPAGSFVNFKSATGTLTDGIYQVTGILKLAMYSQTDDIVTNAAHITLTGPAAEITDQSNNNALVALATNATNGSLTLSGQNLTTNGSLTNAGALSLSKGSVLTIGGSGSYTQSGGKSTVDGTLAFSSTPSFRGGSFFDTGTGSITVMAGLVFGNGGTLGSNVTSSGTITPADSATTTGTLTVSGNYTQNSPGALDINIAASTAGHFSMLNVTGSAALGGTLNIGLLKGFVPTVGSTFQVLTCQGLQGAFTTVNGTGINGSEHFTVTYNANNVTLTVVAGQ